MTSHPDDRVAEAGADMLRISETGEDYFRLFDTVKPETQEDEISASFPWSIAIPMRRHAIEARDEIEPIQPNITGINELEIGSTFIIAEK